MSDSEKDMQAGLGFLKIAGNLAKLAAKMEQAQKDGKQIDVFAAFQEATEIMQPAELAETETVIDATATEQ